jgi:hypothetical protein
LRDKTDIQSKKKETQDFFAAFSHQIKKERITQEEDKVIEIELWESNIPYFDLFYILRDYLKEYYAIDTYVLIKLIDGRGLNLEEALTCVAAIHNAYVNKIAPTTEPETKGNI